MFISNNTVFVVYLKIISTSTCLFNYLQEQTHSAYEKVSAHYVCTSFQRPTGIIHFIWLSSGCTFVCWASYCCHNQCVNVLQRYYIIYVPEKHSILFMFIYLIYLDRLLSWGVFLWHIFRTKQQFLSSVDYCILQRTRLQSIKELQLLLVMTSVQMHSGCISCD